MDGNTWTTDPARIDALLWKSRAALWTSAPDAPLHGDRILSRYFEERRAVFPSQANPKFARVAGAILAARGSAPGLDGVPYELFHYGVNFVARLVAQAFYAAEDGSDVTNVLGPNVDLLAWIPKAEVSRTAEEHRPLQLPSCLRRVFGTTLADIVNPIVTPHLSRDQTGVRGGTCS